MTDKKVSCSVKDLKKNERRGTMKECADKKQVRYYGIKKVDKIMLSKLTEKNKKSNRSFPELFGKLAGLKTKYTKLIKKIQYKKERGESTKTLEKEAEKIEKDYKNLVPIVKKMQKE